MAATTTLPLPNRTYRKLCTCAVFDLDKVHGPNSSDKKVYTSTSSIHDSKACTESKYHGQYISALILLNSPTNGDYELGNYYRMHSQYTNHMNSDVDAPDNIPPCVFICADGAYKSLQKLFISADRKRAPYNRDRDENYSNDLCDVIIGDMDSYDYKEQFCAQSNAKSDQPIDTDKKTPKVYATVDSIPYDVLYSIHQRMITRGTHQHKHQRPLLLHIECQMTTDFEKSVQLVARLQESFEDSFPRYISTTPPAAPSRRMIQPDAADTKGQEDAADSKTLQSALQNRSTLRSMLCLCEQITRTKITQMHEDMVHKVFASDEERAAMESEFARTRTLLQECARIETPSMITQPCDIAESAITTIILSNIAVLGGHGGRIDHEIGVLNCILKYSKEFHIMLFDESNVTMACWPDGITQWLSNSTIGTPSSSEAGTSEPTSDKKRVNTLPIKSTCGIIPFGTLREMETTGLRWNIVKGRPDKCDLITQTEAYMFAFGHLLSTSNIIDDPLVTIDLRPTRCTNNQHRETETNTQVNPNTIFTYTNQQKLFSLQHDTSEK